MAVKLQPQSHNTPDHARAPELQRQQRRVKAHSVESWVAEAVRWCLPGLRAVRAVHNVGTRCSCWPGGGEWEVVQVLLVDLGALHRCPAAPQGWEGDAC